MATSVGPSVGEPGGEDWEDESEDEEVEDEAIVEEPVPDRTGGARAETSRMKMPAICFGRCMASELYRSRSCSAESPNRMNLD